MFTKKISSLLFVVTASLFLTISAASAYELNWNDQNNPVFAIGGFQLTDTKNDYATIKQYTTGGFAFSEELTLTVLHSNDGNGQGILPPAYFGEFKAEIDLFGYSIITPIDTTVYITGGSGNLLHNGSNILGLSYLNSLPATFGKTLFSATGESTVFDVSFNIDSYDPDYFSEFSGPSNQYLIDNGFFQLITAGRFQLDTISDVQSDSDGDYVTINALSNGADVRFNVVPEPTTMLLFGFGLLGLAGITRRRKVN